MQNISNCDTRVCRAAAEERASAFIQIPSLIICNRKAKGGGAVQGVDGGVELRKGMQRNGKMQTCRLG